MTSRADSTSAEVQPEAKSAAVAMAAVTVMCIGKHPNGESVHAYTLTNNKGSMVKILELGAAIMEVWMPDRNGKLADVVLGYDDLSGYLHNAPYLGVICGRVANRIGAAKFTIDGIEFKLEPNNGPNLLHGGKDGIDKAVWKGEILPGENPAVRLAHVSPHGAAGFPGELSIYVTYTLTQQDELIVRMLATTTSVTLCNIASHSYWNLRGHDAVDVLETDLFLNAASYTVNDGALIPTGEIRSVIGGPLDFFTNPKAIGHDIDQLRDDRASGGGYDLNFVLHPPEKAGHGHHISLADINNMPSLVVAAHAKDRGSGRSMELFTNAPGVQLYTANWINNLLGKQGVLYNKYQGFCLETQHFPDSVNQPTFPSTILRRGETYDHIMVHKFSTF